MRACISVGLRTDGLVYRLDTANGQQDYVRWTYPSVAAQPSAFYLGGSKVRAVLVDAGSVIRYAISGDTLPTAQAPALTALPATAMSSTPMAFSPDGLQAVGLSASGSQWVSVDFSASEPALSIQPVGAFPTNVERGLMSMSDGSARLLTLDAANLQMIISTQVGNGSPVDIALTTPLGSVPSIGSDGDQGFLVNGAVLSGRAADSVKAAGLGTPSKIDLWFVASNGMGGILSFRYEQAQCTAPTPDGAQSLGMLDGFFIKDITVRRDFSYNLNYSLALPDEVSSRFGWISFELDAPPSDNGLFWTNLIRCFEEPQAA